jgi:hypothetical protein
MPKKRKEIKKEIKFPKYTFLIVVLLILSLIFFTTSFTTKQLSLNCFKKGNLIECQWVNCRLKTQGRSELLIAKVPDYVETKIITEVSGSVTLSPSEIAGTYTLLLSCENKEIIQQLVIS